MRHLGPFLRALAAPAGCGRPRFMVDCPHGQVRKSTVDAACSAGDGGNWPDECGSRLSAGAPPDAGSTAAGHRNGRRGQGPGHLSVSAPAIPERPGTNSALRLDFGKPAGPDSGPRGGTCAALPPRRIADRAALGEQVGSGQFGPQSKRQAGIVDSSENPVTVSMPLPLRILYVEDNPLVREVTSELLIQEQRYIVALGTAEEALEEFREQPFDVVITDVSLPAMSGLDLARKILDIRPHVPIIVASGYALDLSLQGWGPKVRAIVKPFEAEQIDALIAEMCPQA